MARTTTHSVASALATFRHTFERVDTKNPNNCREGYPQRSSSENATTFQTEIYRSILHKTFGNRRVSQKKKTGNNINSTMYLNIKNQPIIPISLSSDFLCCILSRCRQVHQENMLLRHTRFLRLHRLHTLHPPTNYYRQIHSICANE